jgi:hypothetical protein
MRMIAGRRNYKKNGFICQIKYQAQSLARFVSGKIDDRS